MSSPYTGRSANEVAEALGGYDDYCGLTRKRERDPDEDSDRLDEDDDK